MSLPSEGLTKCSFFVKVYPELLKLKQPQKEGLMNIKKIIAIVNLLFILLGGIGGGCLAQKATGGNWLLGFIMGFELVCLVVWLFVLFTKSKNSEKEKEEEDEK